MLNGEQRSRLFELVSKRFPYSVSSTSRRIDRNGKTTIPPNFMKAYSQRNRLLKGNGFGLNIGNDGNLDYLVLRDYGSLMELGHWIEVENPIISFPEQFRLSNGKLLWLGMGDRIEIFDEKEFKDLYDPRALEVAYWIHSQTGPMKKLPE